MNHKITLPWERLGQILSHLHSSISGTLWRVFEGTKHRSPDSAGTYSSTLELSYLIQHSIFGTEVTCFKIGGEKKKVGVGMLIMLIFLV